MKKITARLMLAAMLLAALLMLTGCAPANCEMCGTDEGKLKKMTVSGETVWLCPDCQSLAALANAFGF